MKIKNWHLYYISKKLDDPNKSMNPIDYIGKDINDVSIMHIEIKKCFLISFKTLEVVYIYLYNKIFKPYPPKEVN